MFRVGYLIQIMQGVNTIYCELSGHFKKERAKVWLQFMPVISLSTNVSVEVKNP